MNRSSLKSVHYIMLASLMAMMVSACGSDIDSGNSVHGGLPSGGNTSPVISGVPPKEVIAGQAYVFQPSASDADGDSVTFAIVNKPTWASFLATTGKLSGTPDEGDIGATAGIRISVSDGQATSALPSFTLTVSATSDSGSVVLNWVRPVENNDGSQLTDLTGYRIYYGTSLGVLDTVVSVTDPNITTYTVENLAPNTYFFSLTAVNSAGVESDPSNVEIDVVG